jgi:hypothetical protein
MTDLTGASAWRNLREPRKPRRKVGRPRKHDLLNMFYGIPAEQIVEWCGVGRSTAYAWKTGSLKPSKPAAKLFRLHRDRRVLTDEWQGWVVTGANITDPDGNGTSRSVLHNYALMMQLVREVIERNGTPEEVERWRVLLRVA